MARLCMKKSVKQRIEEFARMVTAIQDLSLARLRSRRREGLADYEVAVTGIIAALKRVNQDEIWREAAVRLTALRAGRGDGTQVTGSLVRNAVQCRTVLRSDVHECVVETLQAELDAVFEDAISSNRQAALATRLSRWPCSPTVQVAEDSRSAKVDSRRLYLLAVGDVFAVTGVVLEVKLERKIDEITFAELLRITGDVRNFASTIAYIIMKPGSVSLFIEVTSEDANRLKRRFRDGELRTVGGITVEAIADGKAPPVVALAEFAPVMLDLTQPLTKTDQSKLAEFVQHEQERARNVAPGWNIGARATLSTILGWLSGLNRRPRISILARFALVLTFAAAGLCKSWLNLVFVWFPRWFGTNESLERTRQSPLYCIVHPWAELNRVKLVEESLNAFVLWPMMTAATIAIILLAVVHPGLSVLLWGAASGAVLSTAGGLVCSSVLSIRACGAAGVVLGTAFGVVHGLIAFANGGVGSLATAVARGDAFTRIVGGLVAVDAPRSLGASLASALLVLGLPAIGIASTARLMAQPLALREPDRHGVWREAAGVGLGSLTGIGVLLLMKTSQRLGHFVDPRTAFLMANSLVSLVALSCLFRLRIASMPRIAAFALIYSIAGTMLAAFALWSPVDWPSLLASSGATGMFHAQFFTLAWVVGYRIGGWRAGVTAATLQGLGGYVGYALSRAF